MRRRNLARSAGPEGPDDLCLKLGFEPLDWDFSLEVGFWAQRWEYKHHDWDLGLEAGKWTLD